MGTDAGDNYHSWMTTQELRKCTQDNAGQGGLMEACKSPLMTIHTMDHPYRGHQHQRPASERAQDKPGAGAGMLQQHGWRGGSSATPDSHRDRQD
eukprot:12098269-Heterocapsa_arctica.AAC.1